VRPLTAILGTTVLALGGLGALLLFRGEDWQVRSQAVGRRELALRVLGEHLATEFPGTRALVVSNPFSQQDGQGRSVYAFEAAAVRGLERGWGGRIRLVEVVFPALSAAAAANPESVPIPPDATTPLSFLTAEGAWEAMLGRHTEVDLVVSLIGLPVGMQQREWWRRAEPRFALLLPDLRLLGEGREIEAAFISGKIVAAVLRRPGAPPESVAALEDAHAEFGARFLLVTPANVGAVLEQFPNLF